MYTPANFNETDPDKFYEFMEENSFATVISVNDDGNILHTQTPLIVSEDRKKLLGHIAKANPQWNSWVKVKVLFQGAHTYISPRYYASSINVPTWNYQTVSVDGNISLISDCNEKIDVMKNLVSQYEQGSPQPWEFDPNDSRYDKLFEMITFFEIEISDIKANFKLNQNKSKEDQLSVISHLNATKGLSDNQLIAKAMKENLIP